jgi:hypothetical protein
MVIRVDTAIWPAHDRLWCHLISDTSVEELHAFARDLGIPERGFEGDHYDIPDEYRDQAIAKGAVPVTSREIVTALYASGQRQRPSLRNA